jgi:SAM-dependent methyltransferase
MKSGTAVEVVDEFFQRDVDRFLGELTKLTEAVGAGAPPRADRHFQRLCAELAAIRGACQKLDQWIGADADLRRSVQRRYRQAIAPWFDHSWFMHRAKTKPRGYPGDFELLQAIYDRQPLSKGIGGYLDLYFLHTTLGQAVCARMTAAREFLIQEAAERRGMVRVLNVASGAFREYQEGLQRPPQGELHFTCIDNDAQALEFVQSRVVAAHPQDGIQVECARYNALRMSIARTTVRIFGRFDIIYSIGLLDYLPDRHVVGILRGLRETLNPGGVLYVSFKDATRYDKTDYQWLVDWYFEQRNEEDCRRLLAEAGFPANQLQVTRDGTGSVMNFVGRLRPVWKRIDLPADLLHENHLESMREVDERLG